MQNRKDAPAMPLPAETLPNSGVPEVVVDVFDPVQGSSRSASSAVRVACSACWTASSPTCAALAMSSRAAFPLPAFGQGEWYSRI